MRSQNECMKNILDLKHLTKGADAKIWTPNNESEFSVISLVPLLST